MPDHLHWWARGVALDPDPTAEQIQTAKQILKLSVPERKKYWIFSDQLRARPRSEMIQVQKATRKPRS